MSPRFSSSVTIAKGVKVNFNKSGPSLSYNRNGVNFKVSADGVTTGRGGRRKTQTGAPFPMPMGTPHGYGPGPQGPGYGGPQRPGSYSHSYAGTHSNSHSSAARRPINFTVMMDEKGRTWVVDGRKHEITDPTILRQIKSDPEYKFQKEQLERQRQADISATLHASVEENEKFLNIYKYTPVVDRPADFRRELDQLQPEKFRREVFPVPEPREADIRRQLESEAVSQVNGMFFVERKREEYVRLNLPVRMERARQDWLEKKYNFEAEQDTKEAEFNSHVQDAFESKKAYLGLMLRGDTELVSEAIEDWIGNCQLPVEINVSYNYIEDDGTLFLDVDLPEIEDLPQTEMGLMTSGNLKEKSKTKKQLQDEYATVVFGLAVFITANVFNLSPAIRRILISGYTQRRDRIGNIEDTYIYSIKFPREMFEKQNFANKDPMSVCMAAENRCNPTSTLLFKEIVPFDCF